MFSAKSEPEDAELSHESSDAVQEIAADSDHLDIGCCTKKCLDLWTCEQFTFVLWHAVLLKLKTIYTLM